MNLKLESQSFFNEFGNEVRAVYSDRRFSEKNQQAFLSSAGLQEIPLITLKQVHGSQIVRVKRPLDHYSAIQADGLVTDEKGIALGVLTADCVPVFYFDPVRQVVGMVHAGWRGALHGIVSKMVVALRQNFRTRAEDLRVAIGPCIRKEAYEVGAEFKEHFPDHFEPTNESGEKGLLDLVSVVKKELANEGVLAERIEDCGRCTVRENHLFYSYRAEGSTRERIFSVICLI